MASHIERRKILGHARRRGGIVAARGARAAEASPRRIGVMGWGENTTLPFVLASIAHDLERCQIII